MAEQWEQDCEIIGNELSRLQAENAAMRGALEACAAWHWAETQHDISQEAKMELCNFSEWLTLRALLLTEGDPSMETYHGVPSMVIWPEVRIRRADEEGARAIVDQVIKLWRAAVQSHKEGTGTDG